MPNRISPNRQKIISHSEFGPITIRQGTRYRRLALRIHPKSGITLTAPLILPEATVQEFIRKHESWIRKHILTLKSRQEPTVLLKPGESITTRQHAISLHASMTESMFVERTDKGFTLFYPFYLNYSEEKVQKAVRAVLTECWREEAASLLPVRLKELSAKTGLSYGRVTIRNTRTRWGSCSARNDISLSLHLMRLPDHLVDYVLLHELAHTREKNHKKPFWALLETILPGARQMDRELSKHRLDYYS